MALQLSRSCLRFKPKTQQELTEKKKERKNDRSAGSCDTVRYFLNPLEIFHHAPFFILIHKARVMLCTFSLQLL